MRTVECEQRSAEWLHVRCGRITASRIADVMAVLKRGKEEAAARRDYRMDLIAERLSGRAEEHYVSPEMKWGEEQEQFGRTAYELETGRMVDQIGFVLHPTMDYAGASPDALVGSDGLLELKCCKTTTHVGWKLGNAVPEEYQLQMQWNLACTERAWCDFVSYDPRLPENLRLFVVRMPRDEARISAIEEEVRHFNREIEAVMESLGAPTWDASMPPSHAELNAVTEKVGDLDVPVDILNMLESRELCP